MEDFKYKKLPRVILINGYPGSGKDTFVELCSKFARVDNILTSTPAKEALKLLGWDGEKTPEARDLLAQFMEISYEHFNGPVRYVLDEIAKSRASLIFIHVREPQNIDVLKDAIGRNVLTVFVDRQSQKGSYNNDSDSNVENYVYDITIDNNGTIDDLKGVAFSFTNYAVRGWV